MMKNVEYANSGEEKEGRERQSESLNWMKIPAKVFTQRMNFNDDDKWASERGFRLSIELKLLDGKIIGKLKEENPIEVAWR